MGLKENLMRINNERIMIRCKEKWMFECMVLISKSINKKELEFDKAKDDFWCFSETQDEWLVTYEDKEIRIANNCDFKVSETILYFEQIHDYKVFSFEDFVKEDFCQGKIKVTNTTITHILNNIFGKGEWTR